jgi:hypothetical protein
MLVDARARANGAARAGTATVELVHSWRLHAASCPREHAWPVDAARITRMVAMRCACCAPIAMVIMQMHVRSGTCCRHHDTTHACTSSWSIYLEQGLSPLPASLASSSALQTQSQGWTCLLQRELACGLQGLKCHRREQLEQQYPGGAEGSASCAPVIAAQLYISGAC